MVCPRCQAVNGPDAQTCFRCGYPLVGDAEQLSDWPPTAQPPLTSGGYGFGADRGQPAAGANPGTGPWPYSTAQDPYSPEQGQIHQRGQPSQPYPPPQPYQAYPSQDPPGAYGGYGSYGAYGGPQTSGGRSPYPLDEPETSSRSPLTAILTTGIVILIIAMAGGAVLLVSRLHANSANTLPIVVATATVTPTPTVTPAPTPTPAFTTYTDPGGSYQLLMPTDWTPATQSTSTTTETMFVSPDGTGAFGIVLYSVALSQSMFAASQTTFFSEYSTKEGGPGTYSNLQGPTTISLAGEHWVQVSADVLIRGGITVHIALLLANHGGHAYLIVYLAEPSDFNRLNTKDFQPMERSFRFLT